MSDFFLLTEALRITFSTSMKKTRWFWNLLGLVWCIEQMNERLRDKVMPILCTSSPGLISVNAVILGCSTPSLRVGTLSSLVTASEGLRWEFGWVFCIEVEKDYKKWNIGLSTEKKNWTFPWLGAEVVLDSIVNHYCLTSQSCICAGK